MRQITIKAWRETAVVFIQLPFRGDALLYLWSSFIDKYGAWAFERDRSRVTLHLGLFGIQFGWTKRESRPPTA